MNRESPTEKWKRLTGLARKASPPDRDGELPGLSPGMATRIGARWASGRGAGIPLLGLLERASWFGAGLAILLCLASSLFSSPAEDFSPPLALDSLLFVPDAPPQRRSLLF